MVTQNKKKGTNKVNAYPPFLRFQKKSAVVHLTLMVTTAGFII
jgi:hypothetical protein